MEGVYLSLNQGVTSFREICNDNSCYEKVKSYWLKGLNKYLVDFSPDIELTDTNDHRFARDYEKCHIFGKFYPKEDIPNNKILINDLMKMLSAYENLRYNLINNSTEETNRYILGLSDICKHNKSNKSENVNKSKQIILKNRDYVEELKKNIKTGNEGEKAILKKEKNYLLENGREDLSEKVEWSFTEKGDGLGYDILSYDLEGNEKYIEVKTTQSINNVPFNITRNELNFSKQNKNNYFLYRLYDYVDDETYKLEEYKGNLENFFHMTPTSCMCTEK